MRRKDREVSELNEIVNIIDKCDIVRLGLVDDGVPYIIPLNFGYEIIDNKLIMYFHSALEGRKINILKNNPFICFEMDCSFKITRHEVPCEWSAEHESVIGYGNAIFIENSNERKAAMDIIMKRYGFKGVPEYKDNIFKRTAIYKVVIDSMTGKRNVKY